jgi:hypothetical protein
MDANETKMEFNIGRKPPMYVVVWRVFGAYLQRVGLGKKRV